MTPVHITEARKALGLNRVAFAKLLGVGEGAVRYWEAGHRKMPRTAFLYLRALYRYQRERGSVAPNAQWNERWD